MAPITNTHSLLTQTQLFALLGPNGAGKTTTINMLTGFLPPTDGNALVYGETVAHPSGMGRIRRLMGVCPQVLTLSGFHPLSWAGVEDPRSSPSLMGVCPQVFTLTVSLCA